MANMDKEMYDTWQRLLREDGRLRGTDFFAFRLGWLECKAAQQSVHPTIATATLEDSPFETGMRRNAVVLSNRNSG